MKNIVLSIFKFHINHQEEDLAGSGLASEIVLFVTIVDGACMLV